MLTLWYINHTHLFSIYIYNINPIKKIKEKEAHQSKERNCHIQNPSQYRLCCPFSTFIIMEKRIVYPEQVEKSVQDNYRKKLHSVEAMRPPPRARQLQILSWALTLSVSGYVVLFADFGREEHCFSSIRRWFDGKKSSFWSLSNQERQDLKDQGRI
ncbi:hypothetical protein F4703DRAFT_1820387, partial [Phycomyces blakesleeanus]